MDLDIHLPTRQMLSLLQYLHVHLLIKYLICLSRTLLILHQFFFGNISEQSIEKSSVLFSVVLCAMVVYGTVTAKDQHHTLTLSKFKRE